MNMPAYQHTHTHAHTVQIRVIIESCLAHTYMLDCAQVRARIREQE